mmetsp:Transcript_5251/g.9638  ORF Transcript_5251/g.9638 Transcript_5251/m.9638 type:complete len:201 (+) Transcript_5251:213-815(+)
MIENIVESLLKDNHWRTDIEEQFVCIKSIKGSCLNPSIPVVHIRLDLGQHVAPGLVLDTVNDPEVRMRWETNYKSMQIVKKYSGWQFVSAVVIKIAVPMIKNREFVEHKIVKQQGNCTKVIYYSIELDEAPITSAAERGETLLGMQMIVKEERSTVVHIITQTDLKLSLFNALQGLAVSKLKDWAYMLKKQFEIQPQQLE